MRRVRGRRADPLAPDRHELALELAGGALVGEVVAQRGTSELHIAPRVRAPHRKLGDRLLVRRLRRKEW